MCESVCEWYWPHEQMGPSKLLLSGLYTHRVVQENGCGSVCVSATIWHLPQLVCILHLNATNGVQSGNGVNYRDCVRLQIFHMIIRSLVYVDNEHIRFIVKIRQCETFQSTKTMEWHFKTQGLYPYQFCGGDYLKYHAQLKSDDCILFYSVTKRINIANNFNNIP